MTTILLVTCYSAGWAEAGRKSTYTQCKSIRIQKWNAKCDYSGSTQFDSMEELLGIYDNKIIKEVALNSHEFVTTFLLICFPPLHPFCDSRRPPFLANLTPGHWSETAVNPSSLIIKLMTMTYLSRFKPSMVYPFWKLWRISKKTRWQSATCWASNQEVITRHASVQLFPIKFIFLVTLPLCINQPRFRYNTHNICHISKGEA